MLLRDDPNVLLIGQTTGNLDEVLTQTLDISGMIKGVCKQNVNSIKKFGQKYYGTGQER